MGKHTTFHKCNGFEGLTNALPKAMVKDIQPSPMGSSPMDDPTTSSSMSEAEVEEDALPGPAGMPPVDPTISTAMSGVEDTQPSPVGTPPADDPTIPSAIPEAEMREDLSATQSASPARLGEDLVALTATWEDQPTNPLTPANSMGNEGKEYPKWIKVFLFKASTHPVVLVFYITTGCC